MTTVIGGSSPSITFSDSTTQSTAALPLTGGSVSADITVHGLTVGLGSGSVSTNTAVGVSALNAEVSGNRTTAVGYNAGLSVTGSQNAFFGSYAGQYQTGSYNTSIGDASMAGTNGTSTGQYNTAVGGGALNSNTTSSSNTAVGYQAAYTNTTGASNVAFGYQALYSNSTSNRNVAVGTQAGYTCTGASNTFLGNGAGYGLAGGSFNTYLGNGATQSGTTVSYELVICTTNTSATGKGASSGFISAGGAGGIYNGSNSSTWSTTSDARIKENVIAIDDGLSKILALRPVSFDYIVSKRADVSFIAQEYQTVFPEQVNTHSASPEEKEVAGTDTLFGLNKNLDPYLVRAIQQLNALVTAQATEIQALKAKVGI